MFGAISCLLPTKQDYNLFLINQLQLYQMIVPPYTHVI